MDRVLWKGEKDTRTGYYRRGRELHAAFWKQNSIVELQVLTPSSLLTASINYSQKYGCLFDAEDPSKALLACDQLAPPSSLALREHRVCGSWCAAFLRSGKEKAKWR